MFVDLERIKVTRLRPELVRARLARSCPLLEIDVMVGHTNVTEFSGTFILVLP